MTPTTGRPRPPLVILAIVAGVGLAIAACAGWASATGAGFLIHIHGGHYVAFYALAAGLTMSLTALAVLVGWVVRPAPRRFWRLAALLGIAVCAGLAASTCAAWGDDTGPALVPVGLGAAALALIITAAVIKFAADRGVVRFFALVGIAAYPVGWLTAFAWHGGFNGPIGFIGIVFVIPVAALAGVRARRQYRISRSWAVAVGCWATLAISLAALSFAWGFHANSHICPILNWGGGSTCQSHLNKVVFTLIAGGVPPALAAGVAGLAGAGGQRRARPPP